MEECCVLVNLQRTFIWLTDGDIQSFKPVDFVDACACLGLAYPVLNQNDAAEFCEKLVTCLEKRLKGTAQVRCCHFGFASWVSLAVVAGRCVGQLVWGFASEPISS